MKILSISGRNLASLAGDWSVNLAAEPFLSNPVFAISGPTGAGKSTLLDAMCLALYRQTPRVQGNQDNALVIGGFAMGDRKALITRGEQQAYAEVLVEVVEPTNNDGSSHTTSSILPKQYRARWEVRRKRTGTLDESHTVARVLPDGTEEQVDLKRRSMADILGLDYEQFSRAVLLPQGEFRKFLEASAKDRAAILEKLSGTDIYRRISIAIYKRMAAERSALDTLQAESRGIAILADDARATLESETEQLATQFHQQEQLVTALDAGVRWQTATIQLTDAEQKAAEVLNSATQANTAAEPERAEWAAIMRSEEMRESWSQAAELHERIKNADTKIKSLAEDIATAKLRTAELTTQRTDLQSALKNAEVSEQDHAPLLAQATEFDQHIALALAATRSAKEQHTQSSLQLSTQQSGTQKLSEELAAQKTKHQRLTTNLQSDHHAPTLAASWETLRSQLEAWISAAARLPSLEHEVEAQHSAAQTVAAQLAELEPLARRELDQLAHRLRGTLQAGEPCAVCGSVDHPLAAHNTPTTPNETAAPTDSTIFRKLDELQNKASAIHARLEKAEADLTAARKQSAEDLLAIFPRLSSTGVSAEQFSATPKLILDQLATRVRTFTQTCDALAQLEAALTPQQAALDSATSSTKQMGANVERLLVELGQCQAHQDSLQKQRAGILGGRPVEEVRRGLQQAVATARAAALALDNTWNQHATQLAGLQSSHDLLLEQVGKDRGQHTSLQATLRGWCEQHSIDPAALHRRLRMTTTEREALRTRLEHLAASESTARSLHAERSLQLRTHLALRASLGLQSEPNTWQESLAASRSVLGQLRTKHSVAEGELRADTANRARLASKQEAIAAQTTELTRWERLSEIAGSATGDKLQKFAQGITMRHLCAAANVHLAKLSKRYSLEPVPGQELEFQVVDHDMGDERRSTRSLSGGEGFLASLSLALGLSAMAARGTGIDSLFIDEGFGTLDAGTLQSVVGALEDLRQSGKTVGVISHVEGMARQFGAEIRIARLGAGRSKVEVV